MLNRLNRLKIKKNVKRDKCYHIIPMNNYIIITSRSNSDKYKYPWDIKLIIA